MKKIMFNDKFRLTEAVLEGRKTMTRRIIPEMVGRQFKKKPYIVWDEKCYDCFLVFKDEDDIEPILLYPRYMPDEIVAVAQAYKDIMPELDFIWKGTAAWSNKMFVQASQMYHHIRITNVRVERLQDISDEDCMKEGIYKKTLCPPGDIDYFYHSEPRSKWDVYPSPREAFAGLIDKVSGKGTWDSNPYVFVYEFKLIK